MSRATAAARPSTCPVNLTLCAACSSSVRNLKHQSSKCRRFITTKAGDCSKVNLLKPAMAASTTTLAVVAIAHLTTRRGVLRRTSVDLDQTPTCRAFRVRMQTRSERGTSMSSAPSYRPKAQYTCLTSASMTMRGRRAWTRQRNTKTLLLQAPQ